MSVYTKELATDIVFPHIDIYRKYCDGEHYAYAAYPQDGYVMYDTTETYYEWDPETQENVPCIHYFTQAHFPLNFNFETQFTWVAVLRSEVDENYIYGGGDNNHEIM